MRLLRDIWLFLCSAQSEAKQHRLRAEGQSVGLRAFDEQSFSRLFAEAPRGSPWASASPCCAYRCRKYDRLEVFFPAGRQFRAALDLGYRLGLVNKQLTTSADIVVGAGSAKRALEDARKRVVSLGVVNARFVRRRNRGIEGGRPLGRADPVPSPRAIGVAALSGLTTVAHLNRHA